MSGYGTDEGFQAWLDGYGYVLPGTAPTLAVLRQRGSDYIDGLYAGVGAQYTGLSWSGSVADPVNQERQWPRSGANVAAIVISDDAIPAAIVNASYYAAYIEGTKPGSLSVTGSNAGRAVRKKVGSLEVQYADPGASGDFATDAAPVNTTIYGMVKPYLVNRASSPFGIYAVGC